MAFKKKSKAPKKKSKSAKKDDWTFEGGLSIVETSKENDDDDGRRKRRQTQDRDERLRRGRAKIDERKKKKQFTAKMSKKIKFSDVLEKPILEQSNEESDTKVVKEVRLNPLSVTDRLQLFVSKSMENAAFRNLHRNEHDSDNENESSDESNDDVSGSDSDNDTNGNGKQMQVEETADHDVDDANEQQSDDDEDADETGAGGVRSQQMNAIGSANYDWFFSSRSDPATAGEKKNKMKLLRSLSGLDCDVFGNLHPLVANVPDTYSSLTSLPGLNKLWRSGSSSEVEFGTASGELLPFLGTYADALIESRDRERDTELLRTMVVHAATHVVKARAAVIKHNQKLKRRAKDAALVAALAGAKEDGKKRKSKKDQPPVTAAVAEPLVAADGSALPLAAGGEDIAAEEEAAQDQGFSRPRVLILCPFRGSAVEVVQCLQRFLGPNTSVSGLDKLGDEFGPPDEDADEEEVGYGAQGGGKKRSRDGAQRKPADWEALFKGRNIDDDFKIGIQVNPGHGKGSGADKGVYLRLFSDFFISDIVLASPIGLRLALESAGSNSESRRSTDKPSSMGDFLSSVEMVLLHQADVLYMQNWDHVDYVLRHTNLLPKGNHDTDFARVRPYFLEASGASHRQLLMTTAFVEPELQAFFREHGRSQAGAIRVKRGWAEGSIAEVLHPVKQVFQLVPGVTSVATHEDVRFAYFRDTVLAQVLRLEQKHTLIVTPSYLNYVRVRSELMHQQANAAYVCEYSRDSEVSRGRSRFFHGTKDILLYSGRAHFFRRFLIKGARHLVFYSLPEYAHFYAEMVNLLDTTGGGSGSGADGAGGAVSCLVLYTPYERMALERVVGRERCEHMMSSKKATFMFC